MTKHTLPVLIAAPMALLAGVGFAQSPEYMVKYCKVSSQSFYQAFEAGTEATYQGQRTDGTHTVNGTIYLRNGNADFSCSFNAKGDWLIEFFADQRSWPGFVRGEGSPYQVTGGASSSSPAPAQKITNERVRFPPGATSTEFPAQLPTGMTVRYQLGARKGQFLDVRISASETPLKYRILNPDGSVLLDAVPVRTPYRGQLWQSGDHVVEVINTTGTTVPFEIRFGIK